MPRPALVKDVLSYQTKAFTTLKTILEEKGISYDDVCLLEGASDSPARPPATTTHLELDSGDSDTASISSTRTLTLAQKASRNRLSRVARTALSLLLVGKSILDHSPLDHQFSMHLKDSVEFTNICTHMALQTDDRRFDQDLNLAQQCLAAIITNMTWDTDNKTCDFCETVRERLKHILQKLNED
ncbi:leukemia-associated protein 7 [Leptodactylus fuscus]|uniref:leukemia-associated protein 7 n=1 Tax=Leptodactylus fuscus TaxID=238119 RepID=UPI003F4F075D